MYVKKNKKIAIILFVLAVLFLLGVFLLIRINKTSYAIPDEDYSLGDSFVLSNSNYTLISNDVSLNGESTVSGFPVVKHYTENGDLLFSLQVNKNIDFKAIYNKKNKISDYGLLYVMANSYPNKNLTDANGEVLNSDFQTWISQVAIWLYLYYAELEDNGVVLVSSSNYLTDHEIYSMTHGREVIIKSQDSNNGKSFTTLGDDTIYETYIEKLVNNALSARKNSTKSLKINLESEDIFLTDDSKYYQTSLISVVGSPSDNFNGYDLEITNAPDGTIVILEDGKQLEDLTNLSVTDKFYLRVPKNNVDENNKSITIKVIGSFKNYAGNYYEADNSQTMTRVEFVNNNWEDSLKINLNQAVSSLDTNKNISQIIYLMGIIILLCGLCIIYLVIKKRSLKK